jgi:hypothetical protein
MLLLYALYALYGSSILRESRQKFAIRSASQNNAPHPCSRLSAAFSAFAAVHTNR